MTARTQGFHHASLTGPTSTMLAIPGGIRLEPIAPVAR